MRTGGLDHLGFRHEIAGLLDWLDDTENIGPCDNGKGDREDQDQRDGYDLADRTFGPFMGPCTLRLSLIHISEPTRLGMISYAVFCLKKKKKIQQVKPTQQPV
eukprot:TRINITY_DN23155_c0_g1_i1.p3 TRINITY_DN23155_c0_g1~~TRINITY_DN23155_c0_g1_i1.p3  ORF type:complete len:103 (+),score=2.27 TRINITY_DN23155_c0_g1_i1:440-748(+)